VITNTLGQAYYSGMFHTFAGTNEIRIDTGKLPVGMYWIFLKNAKTGPFTILKIIKK
jgi:hypothetical protein